MQHITYLPQQNNVVHGSASDAAAHGKQQLWRSVLPDRMGTAHRLQEGRNIVDELTKCLGGIQMQTYPGFP
jgi:hypothetical protein